MQKTLKISAIKKLVDELHLFVERFVALFLSFEVSTILDKDFRRPDTF